MRSNVMKVIGLTAAILATLPGTARAAPVTIDLWAQPTSLQLPGVLTATPSWGYSLSAAGPATVPGPVLVVDQGDAVTVNLTNGLGEDTALDLTGQGLVPDEAGIPPGGTRTYTFTAGEPGTYLYQAAPLPGAQHQVPMGLFGALVVRPAGLPTQAYLDPTTTFDDEVVLVLSELDPALNAAPAAFDLRRYAPTYFLLNGKAYPDTAPIATGAGRRVLLRYVNAGQQHHSMALLGLGQVIVAQDGRPRTFGQSVVAETVAPGQTLDAITTIPAATPVGTSFALHEGNLRLSNGTGTGTSAGLGGMLTLLTTGAPGGGAAAGPSTGAVALSPNPSTGASPVTVTATLTLPAGAVAAAEYFVDATGAPGSGAAMAGSFGGASATASGTLSAALLATLASGPHTVFVHGQAGDGTWGSFNFATLALDKTGPATTGPTLNPNPTGGAVDVAVHATGSDAASGGGDVVAAEFTLDGGAPTAMAVNFVNPTASLDAIISAATVAGLAQGAHAVAIRSQDSLGNWGAAANATLIIDRLGPTATGVAAAPNPVTGSTALRVSATVTDAASAVASAEGFLDASTVTPPAPGTGFRMVPIDGAFSGLTEAVAGDVPQVDVSRLSVGTHTVSVRGQDAVGNWGPLVSASFVRAGAVADTLTFSANGNTGAQQANVGTPGLLANDLPIGGSGRTATLVTGPVRISGTGTATIRVTCPTSSTPAATAVCPNGSYRVTLNPVGATSALRRASKVGTYRFTYQMTLNGMASPPPTTVTIVVN